MNGVTRPHLADELYAQWVHVFTPAVATTLFASAAIPAAGLRTIPVARIRPWLGTGVTLSLKY